MVFDHVVAALVHESGYERIATPGCSDRTIRRRVREWAEHGLAQTLHTLVLAQCDRMIGIELDDIVDDGWITKAPGGGEKAGRSPVDRGKQGLKRSTLADGRGVPLHLVSVAARSAMGWWSTFISSSPLLWSSPAASFSKPGSGTAGQINLPRVGSSHAYCRSL
jgi:hypothetical protein